MSKRTVLINPPHSAFDTAELGPPLGLLRLAGVAQRLGAEAQVVDFNLLWHLHPELRGDFYATATDRLLELNADIYGFTSMAVDSQVALELGRRVKEARPDARIFLGGTHFSSIAEAVTKHFPWVDGVIQREGETEFGALLEQRSAERASDMDYSLVDFSPYFVVNPRRVADVESQRGCRFKCSFCYSPGHYPTARVLDSELLLRELEDLRHSGVQHVFFVEDNFLNDISRAASLCRSLKEARLGLTWHCYATFPQLTREIATEMSSAGCRAVFSGVDAVGASSERAYGKKSLRKTFDALERVEMLVDLGVQPTCAFLVAPPSHPCGPDIDQTLDAALAFFHAGAHIRLNVLTYYPSTRLSATPLQKEPDLYRTRLLLDVPGVVEENPFAARHPELFPFHTRYTGDAEWQRFLQQMHVMFTLIYTRGDELMDIRSSGGALLDVTDQVLKETGDLTLIRKTERRALEVEVFDSLIARV